MNDATRKQIEDLKAQIAEASQEVIKAHAEVMRLKGRPSQAKKKAAYNKAADKEFKLQMALGRIYEQEGIWL